MSEQQLMARIKRSSKYYGQTEPGAWFEVRVVADTYYHLRGNQNNYRLGDVVLGMRLDDGIIVDLASGKACRAEASTSGAPAIDDNIVQTHQETIEQFIARCGSVFTNDVASRFAMHVTDARRELKRLERAGKITSKREPAGGNGSFAGAGLVWETQP